MPDIRDDVLRICQRHLPGWRGPGSDPLSDYMYALAAIPLAVNPIQKIRFIPYASQRFARFLRTTEERSGP